MNRLIMPAMALMLMGIVSQGAASASPSPVKRQAATSSQKREVIHQKNHEWNWRRSDNGIDFEVNLRGKAEFNDDYTDIRSLSPGGSFTIRDERGGAVRKIEVTQAADGSFKRLYSLNGSPQAYDSRAREWFQSVVLEVVRQGGFDASARMQKILRQGGVAGALEEIALVESDYVKRIYFVELMKTGNLNEDKLGRTLRHVGSEVKSDYEKAETLVQAAESSLSEDHLRSAYVDAASTIGSDYEKGRALSALLRKGGVEKETLLLTVRGASSISSDYEKAKLLIKVAGVGSTDEAIRKALVEAARSIGSEYERGRVLSAVFK